MRVVHGEGTADKRGDWQGFSTSRYNCTPTAEVLETEPCRDAAVPSQQKRTSWHKVETQTSLCCPGKQPVTGRETEGARQCLGKQLIESGPAVLDSRVRVVPLDTERFAPVDSLQQAKFQHKRGIQGSPQEGVIAEHRYTHNGGIHHRILGEPARSDGVSSTIIMPGSHSSLQASWMSYTDVSEGIALPSTHQGVEKHAAEQHQGEEQARHHRQPGWEPNPSHYRQSQQLPGEAESSRPLSTGACEEQREGGGT